MKRAKAKKRMPASKQRTAKRPAAAKKALKRKAFDARKLVGAPVKQWVGAHVPRFTEVRPAYVMYEEFLKTVLKTACREMAPHAIVEARAKGIASFAEKIIRKREEYTKKPWPPEPDPLVRMTDLCGGRVVAQTSEQVHEVSRFIEKAFDIDWPNSEDVSKRLKPAEFGYRSVHYIVIPNEEKLRKAGMDLAVPPRIRGLKAEIQVRTLLEHASADIAHDLLYKTDVKVPDRLVRMSAGLWAVLEGADQDFARLVSEVEEFKTNYGAYHTRAKVEEEIETLRIVLSCDTTNTNLAVKIGQLALAIGRHELALSVLSPYAAAAHPGVQLARGTALTEKHWDTPKHPKYRQGRRLLEAACTRENADAETLCACAESWAREDAVKARAIFHRAAEADPTEPVALSRYIEFEIAHTPGDNVVKLASPMIRAAIERAQKQIEGRVNLPWAWSSLAALHLYVGEPFAALNAAAHVIALCDEASPPAGAKAEKSVGTSRPCAAGRALLRLRETLKRIEGIKEKLPGYEWCERAVIVGLASRLGDPEAKKELRTLVSWPAGKKHIERREKIVIFSGACAPEMQPVMGAFQPLVLEACGGLSFTIFSGGTAMGMSGIAGDVAEKSRGRIRAFGYLPDRLPRSVQEERNTARFAKNFTSPGKDCTPLDPLQGWTDAVAAGVDPRRVKLLAYAGGEISKAECALALALGARVGVVEDKNLPEGRGFDGADWADHPNLVRLPKDPMTLRAFLLVDELPVKKAEFEKAAQRAHEEYVKSAKPKDPSFLPWKDLPESLKISNYHQVAYAVNTLSAVGLGVRPLKGRRPLFDMRKAIGEKGIRRLAELEHGRWNAERLLLGWRYGEKKDVAKKISPYLVPWADLPADIQKFDLDGIESLPAKLKEVGLEVYKL